MNICLFAFPHRTRSMDFMRRLHEELQAEGHRPAYCAELAAEMGDPSNPSAYDAADLVIAAGGDGAFLAAQKNAAPLGIPVLCVHMGRIGYLSEVRPELWREAFDLFVNGEARIEERLMLGATVGSVPIGHALNDVVLHRGSRRILSFEVLVGDQPIGKYAADGLVVATPTGATAYALSCGGPIAHPDVRCLVLTPISPHTIGARPFILPITETVRVNVLDAEQKASVMLDGQGDCAAGEGETIEVFLSEHTSRFVRIRPRNFYGLLREKLSEPVI